MQYKSSEKSHETMEDIKPGEFQVSYTNWGKSMFGKMGNTVIKGLAVLPKDREKISAHCKAYSGDPYMKEIATRMDSVLQENHHGSNYVNLFQAWVSIIDEMITKKPEKFWKNLYKVHKKKEMYKASDIAGFRDKLMAFDPVQIALDCAEAQKVWLHESANFHAKLSQDLASLPAEAYIDKGRLINYLEADGSDPCRTMLYTYYAAFFKEKSQVETMASIRERFRSLAAVNALDLYNCSVKHSIAYLPDSFPVRTVIKLLREGRLAVGDYLQVFTDWSGAVLHARYQQGWPAAKKLRMPQCIEQLEAFFGQHPLAQSFFETLVKPHIEGASCKTISCFREAWAALKAKTETEFEKLFDNWLQELLASGKYKELKNTSAFSKALPSEEDIEMILEQVQVRSASTEQILAGFKISPSTLVQEIEVKNTTGGSPIVLSLRSTLGLFCTRENDAQS